MLVCCLSNTHTHYIISNISHFQFSKCWKCNFQASRRSKIQNFPGAVPLDNLGGGGGGGGGGLQRPPNPPAVFPGRFAASPTALRAVVRDAKHFSGLFINLASCMLLIIVLFYCFEHSYIVQIVLEVRTTVPKWVPPSQIGYPYISM